MVWVKWGLINYPTTVRLSLFPIGPKGESSTGRFCSTNVPLTLQASPARHVAGGVGWQDALCRRQAGQLDVVGQGDVLREFDHGNVVPVARCTHLGAGKRKGRGEEISKRMNVQQHECLAVMQHLAYSKEMQGSKEAGT